MLRAIGMTVFGLLYWLAGSVAAAQMSTPAPYYPHWVTRDGAITTSIMTRLPAGTVIGAHHGWSLSTLRAILDFPGKSFQIAWYVESNVMESDDPVPVGTPVAARIAEALRKQGILKGSYGSSRFANLFELNGSRDKKDGHLRGRGNLPSDWAQDAAAVKAAGFALIAKSPAPEHISELRERFGPRFVQRIVFEDVTASPGAGNPGYRNDARALSGRGETVTLVIHSGAYGGFPATSLDTARSVLATDFASSRTEAFWGRESASAGFEHLKRFAELSP